MVRLTIGYLIGYAVAVGVVMFLSGCGMGMTAHTGEHFQMSGTPEGIRAFGDTLNGAIKTGKETPNAHSQYFATRRDQEHEITARENAPSLMHQILFGGVEPKGS